MYIRNDLNFSASKQWSQISFSFLVSSLRSFRTASAVEHIAKHKHSAIGSSHKELANDRWKCMTYNSVGLSTPLDTSWLWAVPLD